MSRLWTASELAEHNFHTPFLVEPVIPRGGAVLFHGKRNIGKSQFALTLAACLAEEGVLFGRYPTYSTGPVVYVQADMTAAVQQQRVRVMKKLYQLDRLHFIFPPYFNIAVIREEDEVVDKIRALEPSLIVWDTLRKIHRQDSNSDETPSFVYGKTRELFPDVTHIFVHHDKKTIADQDKLDPEEFFRGSGAWLDDADTGIHLSSAGRRRLTLRFTKVRTASEQPNIPLVFDSETMLLYTDDDQARRLAEWYIGTHGGASMQELEHFLLSSFVGGPRIVRKLSRTLVGLPDDADDESPPPLQIVR